MKIRVPEAKEAAASVRAMATIAQAAEGEIKPPTQRLIDAGRRAFAMAPVSLAHAEPISPEDLAAAVVRPEMRRQVVEGLIIASLSAGPPSVAQTAKLREFANALGLDGPELKTIERLSHKQLLIYRYCVLRNNHLGDALKTEYAKVGLVETGRELLRLKGIGEDAALAAEYRAWNQLAEGTLGYHVYHHYNDNGFSFPGEPGGFPEAAMFHDFGHVLSGYNTTPAGETLVTGFQSGYREGRPTGGIFSAIMGISIFSTGVDIVPGSVPTEEGKIGDVADRYIESTNRGAAMTVDLSDDWDFKPYVALPIDEARAKLGIPPKVLPTGEGDYPY